MENQDQRAFISLEGESIGESLNYTQTLLNQFPLEILECAPLPTGRFLFWGTGPLSQLAELQNLKAPKETMSLVVAPAEFSWLKNLHHLQEAPKYVDHLVVIEGPRVNAVTKDLLSLKKQCSFDILDFQKGRGLAGYCLALLSLGHTQLDDYKNWQKQSSKSAQVTLIENVSAKWREYFITF